MSILEISNLSLSYSSMKKAAVNNINLSIEQNEIHALVGESGCGKSSIIRIIAGLEYPDSGEIKYKGEMLNCPGFSVPPEKRNIGMVFQDTSLFPHLTVRENILFGIKDKNKKTTERVEYFLNLTGLNGLGGRYPHEISGGQIQRVAISRALAPEPELILMDEPFNNLDTRIKRNMLEEVGKIITQTNTTCFFITHEKSEAYILADRITVMRDGALLQTAQPSELYKSPVDTYVAEFFGRANHIRAKLKNGVFETPFGRITIPSFSKESVSPEMGFLVHRPWDIEISEDGDFEIEIVDSYFFGDYQEIRFYPVNADNKEQFKFFTHIGENFAIGTRIRISIPTERLKFCTS
jgi:ABC-type Fe3+/spermidine/putrescine transport system ATPase subunit